jgi:hypothetical protein
MRVSSKPIKIHGETIKIDPKSLDPNTEVMRFDHYSMIPTFHHSM